MPKIYKKRAINEVAAFVGGNTAEVNAKTSPTPEMIKNVENSTPGGTDAVMGDVHRTFDWVNGNGPYGVAGRDFSYAISSLALVNPLASGAVISVMGAGAIIHGIATCAYVRSKHTIRRLRRIYKGVMSPDGYALGTTNWLFFGLFSNIGSKNHRIGVVPFYKEIETIVENLKTESDGIDENTIPTMSPEELTKLRPKMSRILTQSYINFYIPEAEISKSRQRYNKFLNNDKIKWDKNVEETYNSISKKMQESTVNAPLLAKKEDYLKKIDDLGSSQVNGFDTKMGYSLKKGNPRSILCSQKLHKLWDDMMKKISIELDKKIAATFTNEKMNEVRQRVDAIYGVVNENFTPEMLSKETCTGMIYMMKNSTGNIAPILLRTTNVTSQVYKTGIVDMEVCNTWVASTPLTYQFTLNALNDTSNFVRMIETKRPRSIAVGRWYRLNYIGSSILTNGQWSSYVYVNDVQNVPKYGGTYVCYSYANAPTPSANNTGVVYMMDIRKFAGLVLGELIESDYSKKPTAEESAYYNIDNNKLFEEGEDTQNAQDTKGEGDNADNKKEEETPQIKIPTVEEIYAELEKYAFSNKGVYALYSTEDRTIVKTNDPMAGKVSLSREYNGKDTYTYTEWCELTPLEMPFLANETDEAYSSDAILDDNNIAIDNIKYPLTYGKFAQIFMNRKYRLLYENTFIVHEKELMDYALRWDASKSNWAGLYETNGVFESTSIADSNKFKTYLINIIRDEEFMEKAPEETETAETPEVAKENESIAYKQICKLFEAKTKSGDTVKQTQNVGNSTEKKTTAKADNGSNAVNGNNNTSVSGNNNTTIVMNGMSPDYFNGLMLLYQQGVVGTPKGNEPPAPKQEQQDASTDNTGEKGEKQDKLKQDDNEAPLVTEIPAIVKTVCEEIYNNVKTTFKGMREGMEKTKFNAAPKAFVGDKDAVEEALSGNNNEENGILEITDAPSDSSVATDSSTADSSTSSWEDEYNYDKEKERVVILESVYKGSPSDSSTADSSTNNEENKSKTKSLVFRMGNKLIKVKDKTAKILDKLKLRTKGLTKKGSDQECAELEAISGVEVGKCYIVSSRWIELVKNSKSAELPKSKEQEKDNAAVESYFDNYDYTKLYEDTNDDEEPESFADIDKGDKDVLIQINSITKDEIEFGYVMNGETHTEKFETYVFSEGVNTDAVEEYSTFDIIDFDNSIYTISTSDFSKIEKFITDKTKLIDNDGKYTFISVKNNPTQLTVTLNFGGKEYDIPYINLYSINSDKEDDTYAFQPIDSFEPLLGGDDKFFNIGYKDFQKYFEKFIDTEEEPKKEEDKEKADTETKEEDSSTASENKTPEIVVLHLKNVVGDVNTGNMSFDFEYKTDIDVSEGVAPQKLKSISVFELNPDAPFVEAKKPNDWDAVKTKGEDKEEIPQYPEEARSFLSSVQNSRLQTLLGLLHRNPEGVNKSIVDYFNAHNNQYKDLDSVISAINDELVGKFQNDTDKVGYLEMLINALIGKQPMVNPAEMAKTPDKERWLVYVSKNGEEKKVPIKVKDVKDDEVTIVDSSTNKDYVVSLKNNTYMIVESAFNSFRVGYKSYESYMRHMLYNVPLNESMVFNIGNPDALNKIIEVLIGKDNNSISLLNILLNVSNPNDSQQKPNNAQSQQQNPQQNQQGSNNGGNASQAQQSLQPTQNQQAQQNATNAQNQQSPAQPNSQQQVNS